MTKRISLIGMSNIGKSTWAKRIAVNKGYERVCCDVLIEKKLKTQLADQGFKGVKGMASWMGFPYEAHYKENSAAYLTCEQETMREIIDQLQNDKEKSVIIDTSGSVIYASDEILSQLRKLTRIVYLEASEQHLETLFKRFQETPKPLIWADAYKPGKNETQQETMKRCYPELLSDRNRRYGKLADVTIPFAKHRNRKTDIDALIWADRT